MKENKMQAIDDKQRCFGGNLKLYADYHDKEWGVPLHNDQRLFEMLILEGAQAGLSFATVLKKREGYRKAFHNFNIEKVALMGDDELEAILKNPEVIRNRLKIMSVRKNALVARKIQQEFGSLDKYFWGFVKGHPVINRRQSMKEIPETTAESDALSKDLKKRGMTFVGSTIMYAFMQAVGMVNDHIVGCWRHGYKS